MAVEFFAPLYLLLSISDAAASKEEKEEVVNLFMEHIDIFIERYAGVEEKSMALNRDFNLRRMERYISIAWDSGTPWLFGSREIDADQPAVRRGHSGNKWSA